MPPHPPEPGRAQARSDAVAARAEVPALRAELDYNRDELTIARTEVNGLRRELMTALQVQSPEVPPAWTCPVHPACRLCWGFAMLQRFRQAAQLLFVSGTWHSRSRLNVILTVDRCGRPPSVVTSIYVRSLVTGTSVAFIRNDID